MKFVRLEVGDNIIASSPSTKLGFRKLEIVPEAGLYNNDALILNWTALQTKFNEFQKSENIITLEEAIETNYTSPGTSLFIQYLNTVTSYDKLVLSNTIKSIGSLALSFVPLEDVPLGKLKTIRLPDSITRIGAYAFYNQNSLQKITIPSSVKSIEDHVFADCSALQTVVINAKLDRLSDYMFQNCTSLADVTLSNKTKSLGIYSFSNCTSLVSLNLPSELEVIDDYAFHNCPNLQNLSSLKSIKYIGDYAFYMCSSLGSITLSSETQFDTGAFYGCSALSTVTLEDSEISDAPEEEILLIEEQVEDEVKTIEIKPYVFYGCSSLSTLNNFKNVSVIGKEAFGNCSSLTQIGPWSINTVEDKAFSNCIKLSTVDLSSAENIGESILTGCSALTTLIIPFVGPNTNLTEKTANEKSLLGFFFGSQYYDKSTETEQYYGNTSITYYIPTSLIKVEVTKAKAILYGAFYNCNNIKEIILPKNNSYSIGAKVFYGCENLQSIDLTNATPITAATFGKNSALKSMVLPFIGYKDTSSDNSASASATTLFGYIFETKDSEPEEAERPVNHYVASQFYSSATSSYKYSYIPLALTKVEIKGGSLFYGAFSGCKGIQNIILPESGITSIPNYAFYNCSSLNKFTIPSGVINIGTSAFQGCESLQNIEIPAETTTIGANAFSDCTGVTSLVVNGELDALTNGVFKSLGQKGSGVTVYIGENVTKLPNYFLYNAPDVGEGEEAKVARIVLHNKITSIGSYAFANCTYLTNLIIPNSITSISTSMLEGCTNLISIVIPDSVTTIGIEALNGCSSLLSLTIPDSLATIGTNAFANCTSLKNIRYNSNSLKGLTSTSKVFDQSGVADGVELIIGASVTSIPEYAFDGLKIKTITFEGNACQTFGTDAFANNTITEVRVNVADIASWASSNFANTGATPLSSGGDLYISGETNPISTYTSERDVGNYAFYGCKSLTNLNINQGTVSIGDYSFANCSNLTTIGFAGNYTLESIGEGSFEKCNSLTGFSIGYTITSLGSHAFYGCTGLLSIYYGTNNITDRVATDYVFGGIGGKQIEKDGEKILQNCTIYIGAGVTTLPKYIFASEKDNRSLFIVDFSFNQNATDPENTLKTVGAYAFKNAAFSSIDIPDSVTSIGTRALSGCNNLRSVTLPFVGTSKSATSATNTTVFGVIFGSDEFDEATSITQYYSSSNSVTYYIPNSLTKVVITGGNLLYGAFYNCPFTDITILDGVTSMGNRAFYNCTSLTKINFNATAMIDLLSNNNVFYNAGKNSSGITVNIGANVKRIPAYLFCPYDSSSLYSPKILKVNFAKGSICTNIGDRAFRNCSSLTSIEIPDSVTSIGNYVFLNCANLASIIIPNSVTSISEGAFQNCDLLESVVIGESVVSIGYRAFYYCTSLVSVVIPDSVTSIGAGAFRDCPSLTSITIGSGVTTIGTQAFYNCTALTSVNFNAMKMTDGGDLDIFYNAGSDEGITIKIGKTVTSIPSHLFYCSTSNNTNNPNIKEVKFLGNEVASIGDYAFYGRADSNKSTIYYFDQYENTTLPSPPPELGTNALYCKEGSKIYVINQKTIDVWSTATNWTGLTGYMTIAGTA